MSDRKSKPKVARAEALSFGKNKIPITDEELAGFEKALENYVRLTGATIGFAHYLLEGCNEVQPGLSD